MATTAGTANPRPETERKRKDILRAAIEVFGTKGSTNGTLADIAEQVGMTHAGVLHHFGSKQRLLLEVLEFRDQDDVAHLAERHIPGGPALFMHLVGTAIRNAQRASVSPVGSAAPMAQVPKTSTSARSIRSFDPLSSSGSRRSR